MKMQPMEWDKFSNHIFYKEIVSKTYKEFI